MRNIRIFTVVSILIASAVPVVAFAKPSISTVSYPSSLAAGSPVTLSATVSSSASISSCNLYVDSSDEGAMAVSGGSASKSYTFPYARVYTVFVFCRDASGGMASGPNTSIFVTQGQTQPSSVPFGGSSGSNTGGSDTTPSPASPSTPSSTALLTPSSVTTTIAAGSLVKLQCGSNVETNDPCTAVYEVGADGKRHAFPNDKVFLSWYPNFDNVITVDSGTLSGTPLGRNVTYRPGEKMVKFTTLNRVYAVSGGRTLRWITTEDAANALYGSDWNKKIDDISDAFYSNYTFGADIASPGDYSPSQEMNGATIDAGM